MVKDLIERKDFYILVFIGVYILNYVVSYFIYGMYLRTIVLDAIFLSISLYLIPKPINKSHRYFFTFAVLAILSAVFFVFSFSILFLFFKDSSVEISGNKLILNIIFLSILPAISEEFFFRGYLLEKSKYLGRTKSYLLNSALFSIVHFNVLQFPIIFILSLWNCYLYDLSKNIKIPIIFHLSFNLLVVLISNTNFKISSLTVFLISTLTVLPIILILLQKNKAEK